jgi:hypothetical protein
MPRILSMVRRGYKSTKDARMTCGPMIIHARSLFLKLKERKKSFLPPNTPFERFGWLKRSELFFHGF